MGRNANHRKNRRHELPESWWSPTHGLVERDNFKGCVVCKWDFVGDAPVVIADPVKGKIHTNLAYVSEDECKMLLAEAYRETGSTLEFESFERTSF